MASVTLKDTDGEEYSLQELQEDDSLSPLEETEVIQTIRFDYLCPYCETEQQTRYTNFIPGKHTTECQNCSEKIPITEQLMDKERVFIYPSEADRVVEQLEKLNSLGQTARDENGEQIYRHITMTRPFVLRTLIGSLSLGLAVFILLLLLGKDTQPYTYFSYGIVLCGLLIGFVGSAYENVKIRRFLSDDVSLTDLLNFKTLYIRVYEDYR